MKTVLCLFTLFFIISCQDTITNLGNCLVMAALDEPCRCPEDIDNSYSHSKLQNYFRLDYYYPMDSTVIITVREFEGYAMITRKVADSDQLNSKILSRSKRLHYKATTCLHNIQVMDSLTSLITQVDKHYVLDTVAAFRPCLHCHNVTIEVNMGQKCRNYQSFSRPLDDYAKCVDYFNQLSLCKGLNW
ncbi:MAG: hypothetical protein JNM36_04175 [Chitinophagales bacterium]|nr:hypothetical protein [Chitinophagales bacterium]